MQKEPMLEVTYKKLSEELEAKGYGDNDNSCPTPKPRYAKITHVKKTKSL